MVRLSLCLWLLIGANDANAWYCSYTPSPEGWVTNLQCHDISNAEALKIAWCPYRPQDPICGTLAPAQPVCVATTESQSLGCPVHFSGAINQSRTYQCSTQSWGPWVTTSNNCTPDPPTCQSSVQQKQVACQDGYTGSITLQQSSTCPDPYGQPIFGAWVEIQNSCVKSVTNPTNVTSPVNPASPLSLPPPPPPIQEPPPVVESPVSAAEPPPPPPPPAQAPPPTTATSSEQKVEKKSESSVSTTSSQTTEVKATADNKVEVPKGKQLVPGFGLVMSLDILNAPAIQQEQTLAIALDYTQELPNELRGQQGFLHGLLMEGSGDNFYNIVNGRWDALRSSIEVQPDF